MNLICGTQIRFFADTFKSICFEALHNFSYFWASIDKERFQKLRKISINTLCGLIPSIESIDISGYSLPCLTTFGFDVWPNHINNGVVHEEHCSYLFFLVEANRARLQSAVALYLSMFKCGFPKDLCRMFSRALVYWTDRKYWITLKVSSTPDAVVFKKNDKTFKKLLAQQNKVLEVQKILESKKRIHKAFKSKFARLERQVENNQVELTYEQEKLHLLLKNIKK